MEYNIFKSRSNERLLALAIAGLSFTFGFLLFVLVPDLSNVGTGNLELIKLKFKFANVGPGIFFALFGAIVTIYSITTQVRIKEITKNNDEKVVDKQIRYFQTSAQDNQEIELLRGAYLRDFRVFSAVLEKIEKNETIPQGLKLDLENTLSNTKDTLMRSVWAEDWGDYSKFKEWLAKGYPEPIPTDINKAGEFFLTK